MVASSFLKIFSIVVLAALSVSAQGECPTIQEDNNAEKKRFIVMFDKQVENAVNDHYDTMKGCYQRRVQNIIDVDQSGGGGAEFDQSVIRDFSVDGSIQGYTSYFTPEFAEAVRKMKNVLLVEEEQKAVVGQASSRAAPQHARRRHLRNRRAVDIGPPWNLDRIDQAKRPLDGNFVYPDSAGKGVNIFVVDGGVLLTHHEFDGRAKLGGIFCKGCTKDIERYNDRGTFVASNAAGRNTGVARKANIIDVRVLDDNGNGTTADMIEGLSFVIGQHKKSANKNSVVNMSTGAPVSRALNQVVKELTDAGIHIAVSAGNETQDACKQSPASAPSAITVGATNDVNDAIAVFSNFGKCVDIFAPGTNSFGAVVETFKSLSNNSYSSGSDTAYSPPLVAGTLAMLISENGNKPPAELTKVLLDLATKDVLSGLKAGSPNLLLRIPSTRK